MLEDVSVTCPACWETITLEIDLSGGDAEYTEDCSVCCRPMRVRVVLNEDGESCQVHVDAEND